MITSSNATSAATTFDHIMIDLETMGTGPDAAILQIGAVAFNAPKSHDEPASLGHCASAQFFTRVNLQSAVDAGLTMDPSTILWWLSQSDAARVELLKSGTCATTLEEALLRLADFIRPLFDQTRTRLWSKGSDFDLVILASAYRRARIDRPWPYWSSRCFRTEAARRRDIAGPDPTLKHHALSDAIAQAEHLRAIQAAELPA